MVPQRKTRRAGTTAALRSAQSGKPDAVAHLAGCRVCATQQCHARGFASARFIGLWGGCVALRKPVMAAVGLRSDFSKSVFRGFRKVAVFENRRGWLSDGNPVVQARPLHFVSLNRASPMPSLRWGVALFAPPNNGMHRTRCRRFHQCRQVAWALLAGDACRWVPRNSFIQE